MLSAYLRLPAFVALLTLCSASLAAQTPATVTGVVTTRADGLSVPGATVSLVGANVSVTTDTTGRYTIEVPSAMARAGRVQLRVEALGLPDRTFDVELTPGAPTTFDIALSLGFEELVTVGTRSPGTEAEKSVPVDIITREQIASSGYSETAQVIQALAPSFNFPRPTITDGTDTRAAGDAARPRARPGARAGQRQAPAPERAGAPERQHRTRLHGRGPERDPGRGHRADRGAA